jgi:hypothetical protein
LAIDLTPHRVFEQDGANDPVTAAAWASHYRGAHLLHKIEHLVVARVGVFPDPVECESFRCATVALLECSEEPSTAPHFLKLFNVHSASFPRTAPRSRP